MTFKGLLKPIVVFTSLLALTATSHTRDITDELTASAMTGNRIAQFYLAEKLLFRGKRTDRGVEDGLKWLLESAEAGYIPAMRRLGRLYEKGDEDFKSDRSRALHWYERGAKMGDVFSMLRIGRISIEGDSVIQKEIKRGLFWLAVAKKRVEPAEREAVSKDIKKATDLMYRMGMNYRASVDAAQSWRPQCPDTGMDNWEMIEIASKVAMEGYTVDTIDSGEILNTYQVDGGQIITYSIKGDEPLPVFLTPSNPSADHLDIIYTKTCGDVGPNVVPGGERYVFWSSESELLLLKGPRRSKKPEHERSLGDMTPKLATIRPPKYIVKRKNLDKAGKGSRCEEDNVAELARSEGEYRRELKENEDKLKKIENSLIRVSTRLKSIWSFEGGGEIEIERLREFDLSTKKPASTINDIIAAFNKRCTGKPLKEGEIEDCREWAAKLKESQELIGEAGEMGRERNALGARERQLRAEMKLLGYQ